MKKEIEVIRKDVHEVLDRYLCGKLMAGIESEIMSAVEWDLYHIDDEQEDDHAEDS